MDIDSFLVSLYVLVDDQWPRFRSERDFWRFASSHLRSYFPTLCSRGQFNRRVRALEPELPTFQRALAEDGLADPRTVYRLMDTTLVPVIARVRASCKGLFCGQATFGRNASKTDWVCGFKMALVVDPEGVVTALFPAADSYDERPIGDPLTSSDRHRAYLTDKGFTGVEQERRRLLSRVLSPVVRQTGHEGRPEPGEARTRPGQKTRLAQS